jgi:hypothetical protein
MSTAAFWNQRSKAWAAQLTITYAASNTRAESRPLWGIPMTDFESGSLHTHGQAVALIATYYKASYSRLLGLVRKRFRSLDPEEMVQALFVMIRTRLTRSAQTMPKLWNHSWRGGQRPATPRAP